MTRPRDIIGGPRNVPPPRVDDDYDDDDRTPLSPRIPVDLEAQRSGAQEEMAERSRPTSRFMYRFRPSFLSVASTRRLGRPRPSSSNYSGDGLPPDTVVNAEDESPKTPQFRIGVQDLPSTRLHLPNLTRTWTEGSNGPPSRPATAGVAGSRSPISNEVGAGRIAEPSPAVLAAEALRPGSRGRRRANGDGSGGAEAARNGHGRRRRHRREGSDRSHRSERSNRSNRSNRSGNRSQQSEEGNGASSEARESRRRRRRREHPEAPRRHGSRNGSEGRERPTPKRFLFCFPWIKSRRIRSQILRCFVSGLFLTMILAVCKCWPLTPTTPDARWEGSSELTPRQTSLFRLPRTSTTANSRCFSSSSYSSSPYSSATASSDYACWLLEAGVIMKTLIGRTSPR